MKKIIIFGFAILGALLVLALPVASAHIEISDMGHYYDGMANLGYVDYQNVADYNVSGAILVFIDNEIVAGEKLDMPIRYRAGFRCSPMKTLEFPLNTSEGHHTIVAYVYSMNNSIDRGYEYYTDGVEEEEAVEIESEEEEVEEWLECWKCGRP